MNSREKRPTRIRCAGCGEDADARTARQGVLSWPRSACGKGTMTDPQHIHQTNVWFGACCERRLEGPVVARSRWGVIDRINTLVKQLIEMWVTPAPEIQRDLFGNETERRVG